MKQLKNKVNPKAGTLKQKDENPIQNVSRKTIAFVLMIVLTVQTGLAGTMAGATSQGSCCSSIEKDSVTKMAHMVKLILPSRESIRKADSEMHRNLYRSLRESKIRPFLKEFERNDAEMNGMFMSEHSIATPAPDQADEDMQVIFKAENISSAMNEDLSDREIHARFISETGRFDMTKDHKRSDEWIHTIFMAENISLPSAEMIEKADLEIHTTMLNGNTR